MRRCPRIAWILVGLLGCAGELTPLAPGDDDDDVSPDAGGEVTMAFRPGVQSDLDAAGCTAAGTCHGGTTAPMPLTRSPSSDAEWMANYDQVNARVGGAASSLLLDKATGAGGHIATLPASAPEIERWQRWIEAGAPYQDDGDDPVDEPDAGPPAADAGAAAFTWNDRIEPLLRGIGCMECHGTSGAYSLESYSAALGFGTDGVPNVIPGDASSLLVTYCEQGHEGITYEDTLEVLSWIVDWDARER